MRFWMLLSIALVINWLQLLLMVLPEYIMYSLELALLCYKVMKMRYLKSNSILKAIRSSLPVATKLAECGILIQAQSSRFWMGMRTRSLHAPSIMKETRLLQDQKIILAEFGET